MRLFIELVPPIAPVLPRRLDTVRDDETEEKAERDPQDQHVSGGFGAPGAARVGCAGALHMFGGRSSTWESGSRLLLQQRCVKTSLLLWLREVYKPECKLQTYVQLRGGRAGGRQLDGSVTQQPVHRVHSRCCPSRHTGAPPRRRELMVGPRRTLSPPPPLSLSGAEGPRVYAPLHTQSCTGMRSGTARKTCEHTELRGCLSFQDDSIVTHSSVVCGVV